jgi:hypothetical protein
MIGRRILVELNGVVANSPLQNQCAPRRPFLAAWPFVVEFSNVAEQLLLARQPARELNQPVHVVL